MKWEATQKAWRCLFPLIIILECFLRAFTKIREHGKHLKETFQRISLKVWQVYHAIDANAFRMQASELLSWPESNMTDYVLEAVRKLCIKVDCFVLAYDHPLAHRTSNVLNQHMNLMDRWLLSLIFHGHWTSSERSTRAWALLQNFGTPIVFEIEVINSILHRLIISMVLFIMITGCKYLFHKGKHCAPHPGSGTA